MSVVAQLRLTACWQSGTLHYTVGSDCCGSGLGTGTGLAVAGALHLASDSESPLATGTTSGRGMFLATSLDSRGLWLWYNCPRLLPPPTLCSSLTGWRWPGGEAHGDAVGWTGEDRYDCRICVVIPAVSLPD